MTETAGPLDAGDWCEHWPRHQTHAACEAVRPAEKAVVIAGVNRPEAAPAAGNEEIAKGQEGA